MRKSALSIEDVKAYVGSLKGRNLKISVNKGRKRIVRFDGEIEEIYPSVFTLKILGDDNVNMLSCSYSDLICGDIKLKAE